MDKPMLYCIDILYSEKYTDERGIRIGRQIIPFATTEDANKKMEELRKIYRKCLTTSTKTCICGTYVDHVAVKAERTTTFSCYNVTRQFGGPIYFGPIGIEDIKEMKNK